MKGIGLAGFLIPRVCASGIISRAAGRRRISREIGRKRSRAARTGRMWLRTSRQRRDDEAAAYVTAFACPKLDARADPTAAARDRARPVCAVEETIYGWIYRASAQKTGRLRYLTRRRARRRKRHGRASRDTIAEKTHISQRSDDADARATVGHWEADLVICRHSRPVLVLHERKTRITLMSRLAGKTAGETVAAMMATFRRLDPRMRGSITFDNDTCFARHTLLRGMLSATTYFCDAYASWQKGGIENANGRIRRWLPRGTDLDTISEADIQEIAMTINLTPRKCLGYRSPVEAFLSELGRDVEIRFA